jgi:hypothetical protein
MPTDNVTAVYTAAYCSTLRAMCTTALPNNNSSRKRHCMPLTFLVLLPLLLLLLLLQLHTCTTAIVR